MFTGKAICGYTDDEYSQLILDCLGHEVYDGYEWGDNDFYHRKVDNRGEPNEKVSISKNYMRLTWLKFFFNQMNLALVDDQDIINRHTRAYAMNLFGSIMFPDSNSSSVSLMYLPFLEDLGPRGEDHYNWGGAVLACLYRELSRACRYKAGSINGPLLLLQMWSWTRFAIGRPVPHDVPFGGEIIDERLAYGATWTIPHQWEGNPPKGTF